MQVMALLATLLNPVHSEAIEIQYPIESTFLSADSRLWWEEPATNTPELVTTTHSYKSLPESCSCVRTARAAGLNIPLIDAKDLKPNSGPVLNGGILLKYSNNVYHVAIIKAFTNEGFLVYEGNFSKCKKGTRIVDYNDKFLIGFLK